MRLGRMIHCERGLTYTLEAILGILLIVGVIIFVTGNFPTMPQKTGEYSKVQLKNIGRDALDLLELAPVTDVDPGYWMGLVYRNYTLVADRTVGNRTFVAPGEPVNFTVYKPGFVGIPEKIVYSTDMFLNQTVLGKTEIIGTLPINGSAEWSFSQIGEFNIRASEGDPKNPITWSNYVTITVGYYYLDTDIHGVTDVSNLVYGTVYNSSGYGIPDLTIKILKSDYTVENNSAAITASGTLVEDFENTTNWSTNANIAPNSTFTQGTYSMSVNGTPGFWVKKTNNSYNFNYYDIVSFDLYTPAAGKHISVELSDGPTSPNKFRWTNLTANSIGWNKINLNLKYPDINEGFLTAEKINTITISVSDSIPDEDYLLDNLTKGAGNFMFVWPLAGGGSNKGVYYIQANDSGGNTSNSHRIIYTDKGLLYADKYIIYEGENTTLTLADKKVEANQLGLFRINKACYDKIKNPTVSLFRINDTKVIFTGLAAGDYYIYFATTGCSEGNPDEPGSGIGTNSIIIQVLPIDKTDCTIKDCYTCYVNGTYLNNYMRRFVPPYVNYNLYFINPDGTLCEICPKFTELINGYPTDEAVTVNTLVHVNKQTEGYVREIRMVLWYK